MGHFEANEEKKFDVRVTERASMVGKLNKKNLAAALKALPDDEANAVWVNLEELDRTDNPVHMARNLPSVEPASTKSFEEAEYGPVDDSRFEH